MSDVGLDISAILLPAVYVLRKRGVVVFVGAAKNPLARLYAHRHTDGAARLPARAITFDAVELRPARVDQLAATYAEVCEELGWSPPTQRRFAA